MINPINSTITFKGVYSKKGTAFSESQLRTIDNIKTTLGDKKEKMDFFVSHGDRKDAVSLSKVVGMKPLGTGVESDNVTWMTQFEVGTYDENHPFKIEDLKTSEKKWSNNNWGLIAVMCVAITAMLLMAVGRVRTLVHQTNTEAKMELVNKVDSLMQKVDTLKNNMVKKIK